MDKELERDERQIKHYTKCKDRMCGALDCPNCYPSTYNQSTEQCRHEYQEDSTVCSNCGEDFNPSREHQHLCPACELEDKESNAD